MLLYVTCLCETLVFDPNQIFISKLVFNKVVDNEQGILPSYFQQESHLLIVHFHYLSFKFIPYFHLLIHTLTSFSFRANLSFASSSSRQYISRLSQPTSRLTRKSIEESPVKVEPVLEDRTLHVSHSPCNNRLIHHV